MRVRIILLLFVVLFAACLSQVSSKKHLARLDRKSSAKDVQVCSISGYRQYLCCVYRFGVRRYCYRRNYLVSEKLKTKYKDLVVCKRGKQYSTCNKFKNGQFIYSTITKNKSKNMKFFLEQISSSVKKNKDIIKCVRGGIYSTCCRYSNSGVLKYCSTVRHKLVSQIKLRLTGKLRKSKDVVRCARSGRLLTCCRYRFGKLLYCTRTWARLTSEIKIAMKYYWRCKRKGYYTKCCKYKYGRKVYCYRRRRYRYRNRYRSYIRCRRKGWFRRYYRCCRYVNGRKRRCWRRYY